ncbi:ribose-5-phosphate isomerase [Clostridium neuense]|uniref:Ribose-5-phosphate isomerase n=1 Tax=Clostridium neuense TaxID=1728934 RepID=A0ABW8TDN0_9CLOT
MIRRRYDKIIELMCEYKGINRRELYKLLKDKNCKYMLFLLLRKHRIGYEFIKSDMPMFNKRTINYNCKRAEKMFLINKEFRDMYFELEDEIEKI